MPAGFPTNAFLPRLLWDAKAGSLSKLDRPLKADGTRDKIRTEIAIKDFVALADPDSVRKGWVHLAPGIYEDRLVLWAQKIPPRPAGTDGKGKPLWQPTIVFHVKLAPALGDDVRQFSSTAIVVLNSLDGLIDGWLTDPASENPGLCPVIRITGKAAITGRNGTNYAPIWKLCAWRPRPEDMPIGGADEEYGDEPSEASTGDPWDEDSAPQYEEAPPEHDDNSALPF